MVRADLGISIENTASVNTSNTGSDIQVGIGMKPQYDLEETCECGPPLRVA